MTMGVYLITHAPSQKVYVGSAFNIERRWLCILKYDSPTMPFGADLKRDGEGAFAFSIAEEWGDRATLYQVEQQWLDRLLAADPGRVYNRHMIVRPHKGTKALAEALRIDVGELIPAVPTA